MSKSVVLTDYNDEQILPVTTAENVFVSEGVTLKQVLNGLESSGQITIGLAHTPINIDTRMSNYSIIEEV